MGWPRLSWSRLALPPQLSQLDSKWETQANRTSKKGAGPGQCLEKVLGRLSAMSFSLNFTLPDNTTSSPVVTRGKAADCGRSLGLAAGIPSLLATALLVALLFTLIQRRRRRSDESAEESERPCEISEIYDNPKIAENPRRSPTDENTTGAQEAHIYVKTVAASEEPRPDTYRPPEERERRRALWWLIPRLSLE